MRILFVADVFGAPGRRAVEAHLAGLREELRADFCIVNGENAADGRGITAKIAERLLAAGGRAGTSYLAATEHRHPHSTLAPRQARTSIRR